VNPVAGAGMTHDRRRHSAQKNMPSMAARVLTIVASGGHKQR